MSRAKITGLTFKNGKWQIDKRIPAYGRLCESTGTSNREEAEEILIHRLNEIRKAVIFGERPVRTWRAAATKYLSENLEMPSISNTAIWFKQLDEYIGDIPLTKIHDDTPGLKQYIKDRLAGKGSTKGIPVKARTINIALQRVSRVLRLCATKWRDELGMTWLETAPVLTMLNENKTARLPYPLSWDEQAALFRELPEHLALMALFKINTGCREQEVCKLKWEWEIQIPELDTSVFLIPSDFGGRTENSGVKNKEIRLVVLNNIARRIIEEQRGQHKEYVFPYKGSPIHRMNGHAWRKARNRAHLPEVRVHDLKHTFGRRLRAAGVGFEDRQALLGHKNGSVTTHYSGAEIHNLIKAADSIIEDLSRQSPALVILKNKAAWARRG
ncbi:tyrosine-type recombinase/integrase [Leeia oryzae]|uniref:tyrosine-type recombinase/integrase n=1 Tax=Leeia oryzae TaxID=356662 RepID=UPI000372B101|nr:site-specific integrase [Leeia oryzae]